MVDNSSLILNEKKNARKFSLILNDFLEILVFLKQFYIVPIIKISILRKSNFEKFVNSCYLSCFITFFLNNWYRISTSAIYLLIEDFLKM